MRKTFILAPLALWLLAQSAFTAEIFPLNSIWRFRKGGSEASSPITAWRTTGFNDAAAGFADALAPFWYGDVRDGGTWLTDMQTNYTCIFLRHAFTVGNVSEASSLRLRAFSDDGFIAWINGVEVARTNIGAAQPTYQTLATNAFEPVPLAIYNLPAPSGYLVSGTNVLVIQAFNSSTNSSDFGFDGLLEVTIAETIPPVIATIVPPPGTVTSLNSVAVTFSEPVIGLTADDLLINGAPPATMEVSGNTSVFHFTQPIYGAVFITWMTGHGITDLATPPNAFNAGAVGATWQYNLVDTVPPAMANLYPPAGLTIRALSQIEVVFSESVANVEASDLLIGGQAATNVIKISGTRYVFGFPPCPPGAAAIAWASSHGITDSAASPNPFAGGAWNYMVDPSRPLADLIINEILAGNVSTNGLADEDGEQQAWIEIYNRGVDPVSLENWSLSDDPELPGLWTFPARTLAPNAYLVVFASGKDRRTTNAASRLHTNFKLGNPGEHLALYTSDAPRVLLSGFTPYPEQRNDISYGWDATNALKYFSSPTPGAPNGISTILGVCEPVHPNVNRGHFASPFTLVLSCPTPGAEIRYTTDGSEPVPSSPLFTNPVRIATTKLVRIAAFKPNYLPSKTVTHSYLMGLSPSLRSLPVISIVTATNHLYGSNGILGILGGTYANGAWEAVSPGDYHNPSKHGLAWERPTSVEWIRPEDNSGFQVDCGIRVQGSDYQRPRLTPTSKFSFRLYFRNDYGPGRLEYPLFPLTPVQSFDQLVLRAGFNEQSNPFIRDEIHRRLSSDMGAIASHGNLAVVFVNGVPYASSPWYNPAERVHEEFFQEHLGGGPEWDVVGPTWAQGADLPGVIDGDRVDFQNLVSYVNSQPVTSSAVYSTIARRLDLTNFADYCILNSYAAMGDWPANNWRAGRDRAPNGVWRFVVWDAEWGMGIYGRSVTINSFTQTGGGPFDSGLGSVSSSEIAQIYDRLRASPEFRLLWADRIQKHFFNGGALTGSNITNRFNELRDELAALMPSMDTAILNWARDRQPIYFSHMEPYGLLASSNAPAFSQFGGRVPSGFSLVITNLSGTIYYTTNGSDPRVAFSGAVSSSARAYSGPIALLSSASIRARTLSGGNWSALTEATFSVGSLGVPLRVAEIMYNPPGGSIHEYLELENSSSAAIDLGGIYLDGVNFQFVEGSTLAGGARLVLGSNTDTNAWKVQYPGVSTFGWFGGNLDNAGERITLFDRFGNIISFVDYQDGGGWPTSADGGGRSLELLNANSDPNEPASWQASTVAGGTPGVVNSPSPVSSVQLSEVMAGNISAVNHGGTFPDWVELRNTTANPVNLAGWSLTDDGEPRKFVFPSASIAAGGYLVVWCDAATNTTPGFHAGFNLDQDGETISLYDPNTNRIDALTFGLQLTNFSVGRIASKWTLTSPTTNAANLAATLAPASSLAINEWLANPVPGFPDWMELYNRSATAPVSLQGIYIASSNQLHRLGSLSFLPPLGYVRLFADEGVGADHLCFKLPAEGGKLGLFDAAGGPVQTVVYGPQAEGVSQGCFPDGNANVTSFVGTASPGAPNYLSTYAGPVINEVLARNSSVNAGGMVVDYIEIYNPGASPFSLAGMSLSVNSAQSGQWTFPPAASLAANSYLLIKCDGLAPVSTNAGSFNTGRSLDGESGGVYLFTPAGQLVSSVEYGLQVENLSIGLSGGQWRLLSAATPGYANVGPAALGSSPALRINEWMASLSRGADWFELFNTTNLPVDLAAITLSDDPSMVGAGKFQPAPLSFIGPGGFVKWVADADPGQGRNHVNFALDEAGESILVYRVNGSAYEFLQGVGFGAQTMGVSQGSLPDGAQNVVPFPGSSTPGESNYRLLPNVVINEALTHTDPPLEDAIELRNPSGSPVDIGGWFLSNSGVDRRKYQLPAGTIIPPGGYTVVYENQFNDGTADAFTLNSAHGDQVWLSAAVTGVETGDRATVQFGAAVNGVPFGRVETSTSVDFVALTKRTFGVDDPSTEEAFRTGQGLPNAAPAIDPVIINEIMYHPNGAEEFIELYNNSASPVPLFDPAFPTNRWKLGGGVEFVFPANQNLPVGGHLLVVDFDPANSAALATFKIRYGIDASVPIYGPFSGNLSNEGDSVELNRPDKPQQAPSPDAGFVPYVLADRVIYSDGAPWPAAAANGGGFSLQRLAVTLYGNEALNWGGADPTPGRANSVAAPDADGDGIPDWAENQMGLDMNDPSDAGLDPDADGMTNLQEYIAGTNAHDAASRLRLEQITVGAQVTLSFHAMAFKTYSVLYKNSLGDPEWSKLLDVPASSQDGLRQVTTSSAGAEARYYRLVTPVLQP